VIAVMKVIAVSDQFSGPNSMPNAEIGAGAADLKFDVKSARK
jgi:hypothetical protein